MLTRIPLDLAEIGPFAFGHDIEIPAFRSAFAETTGPDTNGREILPAFGPLATTVRACDVSDEPGCPLIDTLEGNLGVESR